MLPVAFLLLFVVSFSNGAVVLENDMPILWAQTAAAITDLPNAGGILTPDPWNFIQRMSLYKLIIAATDPGMGSMGTGPTDSPFWGLPLQLAWMVTSARLGDPTAASGCGHPLGEPMCISTISWWGCQNYFVSVLPFLSAAQQGMLGDGLQVQMKVPEGVTDYCTTYADCLTAYPDAMGKWDAFYQGLKAAAESTLPENEKKDALLGLYWAAQMASTYASVACKPKQSHYSTKEINFAQSWLNAAEYVAAAHFQSSLANSAMFMTPLPSRILQETDEAPNIADLTSEENHTLWVFSWMSNINTFVGGSMVRVWKDGMCSVEMREKGREMMTQLLLNPSFATTTVLAFVGSMSTGC